VDITKVDAGAPDRWLAADLDWMDRARRGPGRRGSHGSATAYLFGNQWWGGQIAPVDCATVPPPIIPPAPPTPQPSASTPPNPGPTPAPTETVAPTPQPTPKASHSPKPKASEHPPPSPSP
jgi:hypothetical protein